MLLVFVVVFSFAVLIPAGKEYRIQKAKLKRETKELRTYQRFNDETYELLKELQGENRHIITAFATPFDVDRFQKQHKSHFTNLRIVKVDQIPTIEGFSVYEVNTTSKISSPSSFYEFLDSVNKSDWIIDINFPIEFKREGEYISSSFTMKVYANSPDSNVTASESLSK
jgi:hypothetical protein